MVTEGLNDEELAAFQQCFETFDTNGDGFIDANELEAGLEQLGQKRRRSSIMRMIDKADTDKNEKVDFDEFCHIMQLSEKDMILDMAANTVRDDQNNSAAGAIDIESEEKRLKKVLGRPKLTKDELTASVYGRLSSEAEEAAAETPEMVANKLEQFDTAMDQVSKAKKATYLLVLEKAPDKINSDHKLMFLRAELFDVQKAVIRCCRHWDQVLKMFGEDKAFLPLTLNGALKDDLEILRKIPVIVDTNQKDSYGQHIFVLDNRSHDLTQYDYRAINRLVQYTVLTRIQEDESVQHRGCVLQVLTPSSPKTWNMRVTKNVLLWFRQGAPVRLAAFHIPYPSAAFKIIYRVARVFVGELGIRAKVFYGEPKDVIAKLKTFGLEKDQVLKLFGGDLEVDREAWIQARLDAGL